MVEEIRCVLAGEGWDIIAKLDLPPRSPTFVDYSNLGLSRPTLKLLASQAPSGLYKHQYEALKVLLGGKNTCLTTGTASGKSLVFYSAGVEILQERPNDRILAIYPLKALGNEQFERWKSAIEVAGLKQAVPIGKIDGQVPTQVRKRIVKDSRILIVTPDIVHAWLLGNVGDENILDLLSNIRLVIIDELHSYSGVFGSNSAFLFRRLRHLMALLNNQPLFLAASATIANPKIHLRDLTGLEFRIIGEALDTSPRQAVEILLVQKDPQKDIFSSVVSLVKRLSELDNSKFLAFVDSRKSAELLAAVSMRDHVGELETSTGLEDHLEAYSILPFRSGYEEYDRSVIQRRLSETQSLKGIISTSALELGIDVPDVNIGVLVGLPRSSTSLRQRIGRIARKCPGTVIIINTGSPYERALFSNPTKILDLPPAEAVVYLENQRIQYIHALCLARQGGEHDMVMAHLVEGDGPPDFGSPIEWPKGFLDLCHAERIGVIPSELQPLKTQAGEDPNHAFPLRDVDVQFQIELQRGPDRRALGSLSFDQLLREAYPGAVYYYTSRPFRVTRVRTLSRSVYVRPEKHYITKPVRLPALIFPNLDRDSIFETLQYNSLSIVEAHLQVRDTVIGFEEQRGPNKILVRYPLDPALGCYFDRDRFVRTYFTTGVIITYFRFNDLGASRTLKIAETIFEAFGSVAPFERGELSFGTDIHRIPYREIEKGSRFVCIYDTTYGGLRLSGRLIKTDLLRSVIQMANALALHDTTIDRETRDVLEEILEQAQFTPRDVKQLLQSSHEIRETKPIVVMPRSRGLDLTRDNEEFYVYAVVYTPKHGLVYKGQPASHLGTSEIFYVPYELLKPIPGISKLGCYDEDTGEVTELEGDKDQDE